MGRNQNQDQDLLLGHHQAKRQAKSNTRVLKSLLQTLLNQAGPKTLRQLRALNNNQASDKILLKKLMKKVLPSMVPNNPPFKSNTLPNKKLMISIKYNQQLPPAMNQLQLMQQLMQQKLINQLTPQRSSWKV